MAVPKKRTSKAKKNKRKTAWKQKAIKLSVSNESKRFYADTLEDFTTQNIAGFQPLLRFKYQLTDKIRSKAAHFMDDQVIGELQAQAAARVAFNPQSKSEEILDNEVKVRFAYNSQLKKEKEKRVKIKKQQKESDRQQKQEQEEEALKNEKLKKEKLKNEKLKNEKEN